MVNARMQTIYYVIDKRKKTPILDLAFLVKEEAEAMLEVLKLAEAAHPTGIDLALYQQILCSDLCIAIQSQEFRIRAFQSINPTEARIVKVLQAYCKKESIPSDSESSGKLAGRIVDRYPLLKDAINNWIQHERTGETDPNMHIWDFPSTVEE